jgi:membrane protein involved in D-alanine export
LAPYADFTYFGLLLYIVVPTIVLGLFGRANARWVLVATALVAVVQFSDEIPVRPAWPVRELWIVLGFAAWQVGLAYACLRWRGRLRISLAVTLALVPLAVAKWLPHLAPGSALGFAGVSYVTFRALDVVFSIHDGVIKQLSLPQLLTFLFFFPTVSSGPIDRYRRFATDWQRQQTPADFLNDLDVALQHVFRGFLYKFILAALIQTYWIAHISKGGGWNLVSYMYGYSLYLFFDFAGYSAFAIGFSYLLGVRTPENFRLPFLATNIRDFWTRWHISLSFWFRDHVYMRFLIAATTEHSRTGS